MTQHSPQGLDWNLAEEVKRMEGVLKSLPDQDATADSPGNLVWSLDPISASRSSLKTDLETRLGIDGPNSDSLEMQMPWIDEETIAEIHKEVSSGRILSPRSSTSLAVNIFQPWRDKVADLGRYLGAPWVSRMHFEARYPTELSDKPIRSTDGSFVDRSPMLDVVLVSDILPTFAIEAKFMEPYSRRPDNGFRPSYFSNAEVFKPRTERLWSGLPTLEKLAKALERGYITFNYLHAAQLIKHALGLKRKHGREGFWLNYVWFDGADELSTAHRREIEVFCAVASNDIHVSAITYQEMVSLLHTEPKPDYHGYVQSRYFDPVLPIPMVRARNQVLPVAARQRPALSDDESSKGRVADEFNHQSSMSIRAEYASLRLLAPTRRRDAGQPYFIENHDRTVTKPSQTLLETHLQRAMTGKTLFFDKSPSVTLIDYEIPTKVSESADRGLGEADLFGIDSENSHVIVELKVDREKGTNDPLVRALLEGLTYTAVLTANRAALDEELHERGDLVAGAGTSKPVQLDARLLIAAPTAYWQEIHPTQAWLGAADRLIRPIAEETRLWIQFVDLGRIGVSSYEVPECNTARVIPELWLDDAIASDSIRCSVVAEWRPSTRNQ